MPLEKESLKHREWLRVEIVNLLNTKNTKLSVKDIDGFLKNDDIEETREICDELYYNDKIYKTDNHRFFTEIKNDSIDSQTKSRSAADEIKKLSDL